MLTRRCQHAPVAAARPSCCWLRQHPWASPAVPSLWPAACQQDLQQQPWQQGQHRRRSSVIVAAGASSRETAGVVEYLLLLTASPDTDAEEVEVLLDTLWSLQYMVPSVMCAAAGTVTSCTHHRPPEQQQQQQPACMFTHAVHFRLSSRLALEAFMTHPLMAGVQEQVAALCSDSAHIVFEGLVAKRLEALFRRGEEFAAGVEHVLLLQPGSAAATGADAFLAQLGALAESSVAGGIQASHGAVISCVHAAATHVLMTRFATAGQVEQLLRTPACAAVLGHDPRVPVVAIKSLTISMQPTEESTRVDGRAGG